MQLRQLIVAALAEDIGPGDRTTEATVDRSLTGIGTVLAKQSLVVAGLHAAAEVFAILAEQHRQSIQFHPHVTDGTLVSRGTVVATVQGPFSSLLSGERLALNFLMRLSGIATHVRNYVEAAGEPGPRILDTRKTTPLHRDLEKAAVRAGGGMNHRHALFDGILIKDNHIAAAGSITEALRRAKQAGHHLFRPEVEVSSRAQIDEALAAGAEVLLLDNFDDASLAAEVSYIRAKQPNVILEASGNMTPERIRNLRGIPLDYISAGGLIHQAQWVDLSLKICPETA